MGTQQIVRVAIDTNMVVSALLFGGTPGQLLGLWQEGQIQPFASPAVVDEYLRVLAYPRFQLGEKEIEYLIYRQILPYFQIVTPEPGPVIVNADPSDDAFLHCAVKARVHAIISGDRHLLALETFEDIPIVTTAVFLERF
ncbi:MAG: putative toxin-antitoxin system toxin component, PIN family [Desulfobacterales bacterium]|nr:putative toxin-antitoxin system toxin component, PIN family [Desulfobacterales bacterium]